jgi:hypothetical protein
MPLFLVLGIEPRPSLESFATSSNDMPITTHEDAISRNRQFFALATATKPCLIKNYQARYTHSNCTILCMFKTCLSQTSYNDWKELTLKPIDFIRFGLYLTDQLEVYAPHYLGGTTIVITSYINVLTSLFYEDSFER